MSPSMSLSCTLPSVPSRGSRSALHLSRLTGGGLQWPSACIQTLMQRICALDQHEMTPYRTQRRQRKRLKPPPSSPRQMCTHPAARVHLPPPPPSLYRIVSPYLYVCVCACVCARVGATNVPRRMEGVRKSLARQTAALTQPPKYLDSTTTTTRQRGH